MSSTKEYILLGSASMRAMAYSVVCGSDGPSWRVNSAYPRMAARGVRSSWLASVRNGRMRRSDSARAAKAASTLSNSRFIAARDPAASLTELNAVLEGIRTCYNDHRPHLALRGATPAEAFHATVKARPANRPLPGPVFVSRNRVDEVGGNLYVPPYRVHVGLRWAGDDCISIRDGDRITIFSGNRLVRPFTADPTHKHHRGYATTRTYGTREPKPAP